MGTQDISRFAFDPEKHYRSVGSQQGRVITDDDWNDDRRMQDVLDRGLIGDVVGPAGSPDDGFRISAEVDNGRIELTIQAGIFYLGGQRLSMASPQFLTRQTDLLQGITAIEAESGRTDLIYLEAYQHVVTAVEDRELFEVALGSADTSTRLRTMQRVHLYQGVNAGSCEAAWEFLRQLLAGYGDWNEDNAVVPDAQLRVAFDDSGSGGDLCRPTAAGGYLGAENQALRVQLVDDRHFTWGFDNAAPLYRVEAGADRRTLTLLTAPKDQMHWPQAEQVVEILPWTAVLPNNEKLADDRGHLTRVTTAYNPDTGVIEVADAIPEAGFEKWADRGDAGSLSDTGVYYFLRVWNRGSDRESDEAIEFTPGTEVSLGHTGVGITFEGSKFIPGDYWIVALRPESPNQVMPWIFEQGRGPNGVRRYFSPLALVTWQDAEDPAIIDCRPRFRPLTRQKICCSYVVGDGVSSHGDFDSIEEAVARLPPQGGEICLLPGQHEANVVMQGLQGITVKGCGHRTRVIPRHDGRDRPIFRIEDSCNIRLLNMELVALDNQAVVLSGSAAGDVCDIEIRDNAIIACRQAIHSLRAERLTVQNNRIRMLDKAGGDVAIYSLGDDVLIRDNDIGVLPPDAAPPPDSGDDGSNPNPADDCLDLEIIYLNPVYLSVYTTFVWAFDILTFIPVNPYKTTGGIQVGSGSERVEILHNRIIGGAGNGVTIGSDAVIEDFEVAQPPRSFDVRLSNRSAVGFATYQGNAFVNEAIVFSQGEDIAEAISNDTGYFSAVVEREGSYSVSLANPNFQIASVEEVDAGEFGTYLQVIVEDAEFDAELDDVLAFIYQVTIEDNRIQSMGESGIGFPRMDSEDILETVLQLLQRQGLSQSTRLLLLLGMLLFGTFTGLVTQLVVRNNYIGGCLRNLFVLREGDLGRQFRGVGGISLAFVEEATISGNRIEENGVNHRGPVQGIFIISTAHAEIRSNQIRDNGANTPNAAQNPLVGGIFVFMAADFASFGNTTSTDTIALLRAETPRTAPLQVLRVNDNVIQQPLGRALTVFAAAGPLSINDNQCITEYSTSTDFERSVLSGIEGRVPTLALMLALRALAASAGSFFVQNVATIGNNKILNNQVTLIRPNDAAASVAVQALTGIQFCHNHVQTGTGDLVSNVLALSTIVDASHNHIQEGTNAQDGKVVPYLPLSMVSVGVQMNTTTLNQSDHCVLVFGRPGFLIDSNNIVLTDTDRICPAILGDYRGDTMNYVGTYYYAPSYANVR